MHGLDWRRDKWGRIARIVLKTGEQCAIRFPNRTTVVSRFLERYYPERYNKQVTYIPNGVPAMPDKPLNRLERFKLEPHKFVLYLGRIVPEKGCHYLIEAFRQLDTDMKLAIVGDARHATDYLDKVKELARGDDRIVFTGALYGEDKEEAFSNAYVFCLPSDLEGLPIVLLEAMGAGCCCLTSDIPELLEVIDPVRMGYEDPLPDEAPSPHGAVFAKGDVGSLAGQLRHLLDSPAVVRGLGDNAVQHVSAEYNWDRIAQQYEAVYEEVSGRG